MRTIGDELISSEPVAIMELIKNSYDADATRVLVRVENLADPKRTSVSVLDNGHGMSRDTVLGAWLEPATANKRENNESPKFKRRCLGEKGVGRFAAARLGRFILLATRREASDQETQILLDWHLFDDTSKYLEDVEILWETRPPSEISPRGTAGRLHWDEREDPPAWLGSLGTLIAVNDSTSRWDRTKVEHLRRSLERLTPPVDIDVVDPEVASEASDRFSIWLEVEGHDDLSGLVQPPEILRRPDYRIAGRIEADGTFSATVTVDNLFTRKAGLPLQSSRSQGRLVFEVSSPRDGTLVEARRLPLQTEEPLPKNLRPPLCGPLALDLRVWDLDREAVGEQAARQELGPSLIRRTIRGASGVSVFRDGFRVLPYGEPNNDWLRLDLRRVNKPTMRVSANQVVGTVSIHRDQNPDLSDQSNREGVVDSPALEDFRALIRAFMSILEESRYASRERRAGTDTPAPGLFKRLQLDELSAHVAANHPEDTTLAALIAKKQEELADDSKRLQDVLARYRSMSVLGQLVHRVTHDIRGPLGAIKNKLALIERQLSGLTPAGAAEVAALGRVREHVAAVEKAQIQVSGVVDSLARFGLRKRGAPRPFALEDLVADTAAIFREEMNEKQVVLRVSPGKTMVTGDEGELSEVFANLLLNSLYWLAQVEPSRRQIQVDIAREEEAVSISFSDGGPGVDAGSLPFIFDPYYSTREGGMGLGLAIIGEIVRDYYDGDVDLVADGPLLGATFKLLLRRRVGHA